MLATRLMRTRVARRVHRALSTSTINRNNNPLLRCIEERNLPPFQQLQVTHLEPAVQHAVNQFTHELTTLEQELERIRSTGSQVTWEDVVDPLELLGDPLERSWGVVSHLMSVKNSDALRQAHERLQQPVIEAFTRCGQSKLIYSAFESLRKSDDWQRFNVAQQRVVELTLRAAKMSGVGLEGKKKEQFNKLKLRGAELSTKFSMNVLDSTKAFSLVITDKNQLAGCSPSLLTVLFQNAAEDASLGKSTPEKGPWKLTLDPPVYLQLMKSAENRKLREKLYRAFATRASAGTHDNEPIMNEILAIRKEKAELLGFKTHAEVSLASKMAPSVEAVEKMHEELREKCEVIAKHEFQRLCEYARAHGQTEPLAQWDVAFWSEKLKAELFAFTDEEIKPYFPLQRVLDGLFSLTSKLFGVIIEAADGEEEVWHPDVRFFHVRNGRSEKKELIASFFLDPYSRPKEKNGGAWMNECVGRSRLLGKNGQVRVPVAYLICNQSPPVGDAPSLMTFREVETLFHEYGHGLQHMLTTANYGTVAGISGVEWDAVELPSQMMENFCYDKETLKSISGHYKTGEPLPTDLFQRIVSARQYMAASMMMRQLGFGALDMYLHDQYDPTNCSESLFEIQKRIISRYSVLAPLDEERFLCSFSHIFAGGYAAGYYSYKWAEILSCDAYEAFDQAIAQGDDAVRSVGARYRNTVLGLGGGQHPLEVFKAFRGREPSMLPLLKLYGLA